MGSLRLQKNQVQITTLTYLAPHLRLVKVFHELWDIEISLVLQSLRRSRIPATELSYLPLVLVDHEIRRVHDDGGWFSEE